jgi:hypothetical protein
MTAAAQGPPARPSRMGAWSLPAQRGRRGRWVGAAESRASNGLLLRRGLAHEELINHQERRHQQQRQSRPYPLPSRSLRRRVIAARIPGMTPADAPGQPRSAQRPWRAPSSPNTRYEPAGRRKQRPRTADSPGHLGRHQPSSPVPRGPCRAGPTSPPAAACPHQVGKAASPRPATTTISTSAAISAASVDTPHEPPPRPIAVRAPLGWLTAKPPPGFGGATGRRAQRSAGCHAGRHRNSVARRSARLAAA